MTGQIEKLTTKHKLVYQGGHHRVYCDEKTHLAGIGGYTDPHISRDEFVPERFGRCDCLDPRASHNQIIISSGGEIRRTVMNDVGHTDAERINALSEMSLPELIAFYPTTGQCSDEFRYAIDSWIDVVADGGGAFEGG